MKNIISAYYTSHNYTYQEMSYKFYQPYLAGLGDKVDFIWEFVSYFISEINLPNSVNQVRESYIK